MTTPLIKIARHVTYLVSVKTGDSVHIDDSDYFQITIDLVTPNGNRIESLPADTPVSILPNGNLIIEGDEYTGFISNRVDFNSVDLNMDPSDDFDDSDEPNMNPFGQRLKSQDELDDLELDDNPDY